MLDVYREKDSHVNKKYTICVKEVDHCIKKMLLKHLKKMLNK